jgi:uncharacterized membrane protein
MNRLKKTVLLLMFGFYFIAGINHFIHASTYLTIIPSYLPFPTTINYLSGFFEISLSLLIIPLQTRKQACLAIVLMLLAFMPAHIYMIEKAAIAPFVLGKYTITPFIAWLRIPFQALFILWALWCSKMKFNLI